MNGRWLSGRAMVGPLLAVASVWSIGGGASTAADPDPALAKGWEFLQREGVGWIEKRQCVSCHQITSLVWSGQALAAAGHPVDAQQLAEWTGWATNWQHFSAPANRPEETELTATEKNVDTVYQLVLATRSSADPQRAAWSEKMRRRLLELQQDDGSWPPKGQLPSQKRPARETAEVTTLWTLLAISGLKDASSWREARARAEQYLGQSAPGQSTEWWATQLLWAAARDDDTARQRFTAGLLERQRDDGGWGWLTDDPSDALGTGLALYALYRAAPDKSAERNRARQFLLKSQREDGSWAVNSTKKSSRRRATPTAIYWGTAWAVIALSAERPTTP